MTERSARSLAAEFDEDLPGHAPHRVVKRTTTVVDELLPLDPE
jgi:hypothetical protein